MAQELTDIDVDFVSLVDRGANKRTHAVLKRAPQTQAERIEAIVSDVMVRTRIAKAAPSFGDLLAADQLGAWLPPALNALGATLMGSMTMPDDGTGTLTPEIRMQACINATQDFSKSLLDQVAGTINKRYGRKAPAGRATVGKAKPSIFSGILDDQAPARPVAKRQPGDSLWKGIV